MGAWRAIPPAPKKLSDWYYREIEKLGLTKGDCEAIFWEGEPFKQCRHVPLPDGKSREQLEEILSELRAAMGFEGGEDC